LLSEALEAAGSFEEAARAAGAVIELSGGDFQVRETGAARLEHLVEQNRARAGRAGEVSLALLREAAESAQMADAFRALAWALIARGRASEAFSVLADAVKLRRIAELRSDTEIAAAAALREDPPAESKLRTASSALGIVPATVPSLIVELEGDDDREAADLLLFRGEEGHEVQVPYGTVGAWSQGHGTRVVLPASALKEGDRYSLGVQLLPGRSPAGVIGNVRIVRHDGHGRVTVETRPFYVQVPDVRVDLGSVR
jgi:hypothetical protein